MLTLIIGRRKLRIISADKVRFKVQPVYVRHGKKFRYFQSCTAFTDTAHIRIVRKTRTGYARLPRSAKLERAIAWYLANYHEKVDMTFDCYAFACLYAGKPSHNRTMLLEHWKLEAFRTPQAGEVVFLANTAHHEFSHAAIYLGSELYLSVYGAGGDLQVATLHDMQRGFLHKTPLIATPKT